MILSFLSIYNAQSAVISTVLTALAVVSFGALIVFLCKFTDRDGEVKGVAGKLAAVLAVGFAVRLAFALSVRGGRDDYDLFASMINHLRVSGTDGYYGGNAEDVLYPAVYFIYLIFGGLSNAMGLSGHELGLQFMIKLPLIIADLFAAVAVYKLAAKYWNKSVALVLTAFVAVCPIFYIGSAIWTSPITFTVVFACYACYFLARKKYVPTMLFVSLAAFSSKEGIYLFPAAIVFAVYHFVRALINIHADKPKGGELLADDYRAAIALPIGVIAAFFATYILSIIAAYTYSVNPFVLIYEFLFEPLVSWRYFTADGLSVYAVFGRSGAAAGARFPTALFACIFAAIIAAVTAIVYFTKRNRATLVMLIGFSLLTMQIYYPGTSAASMHCVPLVLLAGYALTRDKRILAVLFVLGLCFSVNALTTLANMGQLGNASEYELGSVSGLAASGIKAVTITCSVIALLAHLYYTFVCVSAGMTGQKRVLESNSTIGGSLKEFFTVKKVK